MPRAPRIEFDDVPLMDPEEWRGRLGERIRRPLTMGDLDAVMREVILYYREGGTSRRGRGGAGAGHHTSGAVQLAVVEGPLGKVRVEGAQWFREDRLADQVRLRAGDPIQSGLLGDDRRWLNDNPFRSIDMVYTPGKNDGETDVVLRVEDRFPLRAYGGYEDSGNTLTGENRWFTGFNYGNLWGIDHQLNYRWTANDSLDQLSAHSASYVDPLPWRHTATLFGAYVSSEADLAPPLNLSSSGITGSGAASTCYRESRSIRIGPRSDSGSGGGWTITRRSASTTDSR